METVKKVVRNAAKDQSMAMSVSHGIAELIDEVYTEQGHATSTIKVLNRLTNIKSDDHHGTFIKDLAMKNQAENNGSISIKLPVKTFGTYEKELTKAISQLHGETDHLIETATQMLPAEEKAKGQLIAEQNYLRLACKSILGNKIVDAEAEIETELKKRGRLYIPKTAQLEIHIQGGTQSFDEQNSMFGWRLKDYTFKDGRTVDVWRRTNDLYGRTRVPLVTEEQITYAINSVFALAKSFEEFMQKMPLKTPDEIVTAFCAWTDILSNKDFVPVRQKLSDETIDKLDVEAAEVCKAILA